MFKSFVKSFVINMILNIIATAIVVTLTWLVMELATKIVMGMVGINLVGESFVGLILFSLVILFLSFISLLLSYRSKKTQKPFLIKLGLFVQFILLILIAIITWHWNIFSVATAACLVIRFCVLLSYYNGETCPKCKNIFCFGQEINLSTSTLRWKEKKTRTGTNTEHGTGSLDGKTIDVTFERGYSVDYHRNVTQTTTNYKRICRECGYEKTGKHVEEKRGKWE